ncbi:MAG: hypothetical protein M1822_000740 [Bathelium mastoideum]|nr:MAG: hypothetical protein M1822_000740 [Bathelium mastoideum]
MFLIGPERTPLCIPEELLTRTSPYFASLLQGPFKEAQSHEPIHLPEEDIVNLEFYYYWLLYGHYGSAPLAEMLANHFELLVQLWNYGDRIGQTSFQNEMMQILGHTFVRFFASGATDTAMPTLVPLLEQAPPGSKLLAILCEGMACAVLRGRAKVAEIEPFLNDRDFRRAYVAALHKAAARSSRDLTAAFTSTDFLV